MTFDLQPHLVGEGVELRPTTADDFDALYAVARDPLLWAGHPAHDRWQEPVFRRFFGAGLASGGMLAVLDRKDGRTIGSSRFSFERTEPGEVEIGWTFLARRFWGTGTNREMKALMLGHAFRFVARAILVVGEGNARSRRAVEGIGGRLTDRRLDVALAGRTAPHLVYAVDRPLDGSGANPAR